MWMAVIGVNKKSIMQTTKVKSVDISDSDKKKKKNCANTWSVFV